MDSINNNNNNMNEPDIDVDDTDGDEYVSAALQGEIHELTADGPEPDNTDLDLDDNTELGSEEPAEDDSTTTAEQANKAAELQANLEELMINDDSIQGFFQHTDSVFCINITNKGNNSSTNSTNTSNNNNNQFTDPQLAISGDGANIAYIWNYINGELVHKLTGHTDSVIAAQFSYDNKYAATGSMDGTIRIYNTTTGALITTCEGPSKELEWINYHPAGYVIAAGSADSTVWIFNAINGQCMRVFSGHVDSVTAGCWTPDGGKQLITVGSDSSLYVYNPKSGESVLHLKRLHNESPITTIAIHPLFSNQQNRIVMTGAIDGSIKLVNIDTGKILAQLKGHTDSIESVAFCPNPAYKLAASISIDGSIRIWDLTTSSCRSTVNHSDAVTSLQWHPSQPYIITSSVDRSIQLTDSRTGRIMRSYTGHQDTIIALTITGDGSKILSASDDHTVLVFDLNQTEKPINTATAAQTTVTATPAISESKDEKTA